MRHTQTFSALRSLALALLVSFAATDAAAGQDAAYKKKDVLMVCSHAESSDWAQDMLKPLHEIEMERSDIQIHSSFLRMTSLSGTDDLELRTAEILSSFRDEAPELAVLIGGSSYILADDIQARWPGLPIILAGENDYYCDDEYNIRVTPDPSAARYPVSSLLSAGANVTLLHTPAMVQKTVSLMRQLQPQMRRLVFIAGENFQCREQQVVLERHLAASHPDLEYVPINAADLTTDELITALQHEDRSTTGVLFGSWLTHKGYVETISSRHNVTHIIETIHPVFTLFWSDLDKNRLVAGYWSYDHALYHSELKSRILRVLDEGARPSDMPFMHFGPASPTVNWACLETFGLDTGRIPRGADVVYRPESLWEAYGNVIIVIVVSLFLLFLAALFLILRRALVAQKKAALAAEKANDMKTLFVQNMSHEIRTPMNAIIGFAQLLGLPDGLNTEEEKAEYLSYVMNNSNLLTMLIGDILSLSDMEKGKYSLNVSECDLNQICRMAIKSTDHRAQPGVQLSFETDLPDDLRVSTDGMRVQQVLINYLTNACKHTQNGSIVLRASRDENPGMITFSVTDTGPGVPLEKAEEIFERFVKLNEFVQGTGLGLSICRLVAGSLGGKVWLDTSYTSGARFMFTIPSQG